MIDTLWRVKHEETMKHTYIVSVSAESHILRYFKIIRNDVFQREEFLLDLSTWKQIRASVFSGASGSSRCGFLPIKLLEVLMHQYRGGLTTSKTRDAFVRKKAVAILMWVMRLYSRLRPLSIEMQGNLCGKEVVIYRCRKRLYGKFIADRFTWNLTVLCYETVGWGELELQMESWWSDLLALPISLHVTTFCGDMQRTKCLCHLYHWI